MVSRRRLVVIRDERESGGGLIVEPTRSGEEHALSEFPPIHERFAQALTKLSEEEQQTIAASFRRVVEMIEEDNGSRRVTLE